MKNLAGVEDIRVNEYIQEELLLAGIPIVKGEKNKGEVPYSITGQLGPWIFKRAGDYWAAQTQEGKGLPLEAAISLNKREYPPKQSIFIGEID